MIIDGKCRIGISLLLVVICSIPRAATAHWVTYGYLPAYAQRGAMRSCVCPFDAVTLREWLETDPLACDFNLLFTSQAAWEHPRTPTQQLVNLYLRPRDAHLFFYTDPNSIYFSDEFEKVEWDDTMAFDRYRMDNFHRYPYSKDCINFQRDGQPTMAYGWPSTRHRASYFAMPWVEHEKQIMDYMVGGKSAVTEEALRKWTHNLKYPGIVDGFYFDNAGERVDWGPLAMERWKKVSTARFGKVLDPKTSTDPGVAAAWMDMQLRSYIEFHSALQKHGWTMKPPRLTLLGAWGAYGYYSGAANFPDIEFYENTWRVQPQGDNIWAIKCGLARTHGKAQSCLNHEHFRPAALAPDGSFEVLNWSLTREIGRLSMAECMAMDGNHMLQMGPLVYRGMRWGADYRLYNEFNKQLEPEIYRNALPAAKLAVLYPIASEARGTADNEPLGRRLWTMGIPFEVVMEHDLTPAIWPGMGMRVLILPDARCLNEPHVTAVLDWVRKGGRCLISQSLAEWDELGLRQNSKAARELLRNVGSRLRYGTVSDFQVTGFEAEKEGRIWIPKRSLPTGKLNEGNATVVFTGPTGTYDLRLDYLDEDDGRSALTVYLNEVQLLEFVLDKQDNARQFKIMPAVKLATGDRIRIHAVQDDEEFCRVWGLEAIPPGTDLTTVTYRDVGKGRVAFAPKNLMDYSPADLDDILQKLAGDVPARCSYEKSTDEMGAVFCNLMRDSRQRGLQVHLVNATYHTPERYAPLCSADSVCRADVQVDKVPAIPLLRILCWGKGGGWKLVANVNGTDLDPVDAASIPDSRWVSIPIKPGLLAEGQRNRVTLRLTGKPNTWNAHAAVYLDMEKSEPQSAYSANAGKAFDANDLSSLLDVQRGAYMIEIVDSKTSRPTYPEMRARLVPHENVEVRLLEDAVPQKASALVISPDLPPQRISIQRQKGFVSLSVSKLEVYDVVVISSDAAYLATVESKARGIKYDPLPPRTAEFRKALQAGVVGEKLLRTDMEGDFRLRGVTTIDPSQVKGRTDPRSVGVDIQQGKDFVVEPDGRLYRLPGGRVYSRDMIYLSWTDVEGGHFRESYEPYLAPEGGQLVPPDWRVFLPRQTRVTRETDRVNVHGGEASVRVVTVPGGGVGTISTTTDPGRPYRLSVWLKVLKGEAQVAVYSGGKCEPTRCASGEWTRVDLDFVANAAVVYFQIVGAAGNPESVFCVDDVSLREVS